MMILYVSIFLVSFSLTSGTLLNSGRIIGGKNATIKENPWQVALTVSDFFYCGGSLISQDVVITAAHCSLYAIPFYKILAGTDNLNKTVITTRTIKQIIVHENYNNQTFENDIALLMLDRPINFDSTTRAVPLADIEPTPGDLVRVTGWGTIDANVDIYPPVLQTVDINVINRTECQADYNRCPTCPLIAESMICAGVPGGGKDHCLGDSGGPITKNGVLVGISSWAVGCALPNFPGINTNVVSYREWIRTNAGI